jgi:hypothetical protein
VNPFCETDAGMLTCTEEPGDEEEDGAWPNALVRFHTASKPDSHLLQNFLGMTF